MYVEATPCDVAVIVGCRRPTENVLAQMTWKIARADCAEVASPVAGVTLAVRDPGQLDARHPSVGGPARRRRRPAANAMDLQHRRRQVTARLHSRPDQTEPQDSAPTASVPCGRAGESARRRSPASRRCEKEAMLPTTVTAPHLASGRCFVATRR